MSETNGHGSPRDRIFAAEIVTELLTVEDWDGVEVELRPMTVAQKANLFPDGEMKIKDTETVIPRAIIFTCFDPATGEPIFTEDDLADLAQMPANVAEEVANAGLRISGLTEDSLDEEKKGS